MYLHPGATERFRNLRRSKALRMHFMGPLLIDARFSAFVYALRFCGFDALSLTIFNEATFHFGDHAEYRDDDAPHLPTC